jgi:hypothetical protein
MITFTGLNEDENEAVTDALLNGEAWTGGFPGHGPHDLMKTLGLLGQGGCFTRRGAALARQAQIAHWGAVQ